MALLLTAEQKTLAKIFYDQSQYIIPPYQRAYSWTLEQCRELFEDLKTTFLNKREDGYFLGNIVLANSHNEKNKFEVIDGQQRLITLTLFMKSLLDLDKENDALKKAIWIIDRRTQTIEKQHLKTEVFETKDSYYLKDVLESVQIILPKNKKNINHFEENIAYFNAALAEFNKQYNIQDFGDFLMDDVFLLPIQSGDNDQQKARETALRIFETINDRGLNLSDSDIFKAKLYSLAQNNLKEEDFIEKWREFSKETDTIGYKANDIFRIYSHIIRGKEGIKSSEVSLREFFTQTEYSPFDSKDYNQILADLDAILTAVKFFKGVIENPLKYPELAKWFQLINIYPIKHPSTVLFVYLYHYGCTDTDKLILFSKNLVKYAYRQSLIKNVIKFYIFELIVKIRNNKNITFNQLPELKKDDVCYLGRSKNPFSLLTFYLQANQNAISPYYFDKIINRKDVNELGGDWKLQNFNDYVDTIGNLLIIDFPKKNILVNKKTPYFKESDLIELKKLAPHIESWTYQQYLERDNILKHRLLAFFNDDEN